MSGALKVSQESLAALVDASAAINDSGTIEETLKSIARAAAAVLKAEASSVIMLDEPRGKLVFRAAVGDKSDHLVGMEFNCEEGIAARVLKSGDAVIVGNVDADRAHNKNIDNTVGFNTKSMIAAPLIHAEKRLGVVEILNPVDGRIFSEDDRQLARIFANLAAIAASNSHRLDRLQKDRDGLRISLETGDMIGDSPPMKKVRDMIDSVADADATVLLLGETGTGKEVAARKIHAESGRRDRSFVPVNCAALPPNLLESELFGHEAGAFTGAVKQRMGRFELANGGTIFLDEIGELGPDIQVKLLRVIQEKQLVRVGGSAPLGIDVRIIAATNRELETMVHEKKFRDDLYYRLNVFPIVLPPLKTRSEDIPALVDYFVDRIAADMKIDPPVIDEEALSCLKAYSFPGNIRELQNILERACLLGRREAGPGPSAIRAEHLPSDIHEQSSAGSSIAAGQSTLEKQEAETVLQALENNDWNQSKAARALGISRDNIRYRIKKYGIRKPR